MTQHCSEHTPNHRLARKTGRKRIHILVGSLLVVALCVTIRYYWGADPASAGPADDARTRTTNTPTRGNSTSRTPVAGTRAGNERAQGTTAANQSGSESAAPEIVATVNTQRITREELGQQCRRRYGSTVLESMVNKHLIAAECQRQGVNVTQAQVSAEIDRMAKRFSISPDEFLKMLKQERNITAAQYANDIIWPTLALRELAGEQLTVTPAELKKEFETEYGEMVRARLIAVTDLEKAKTLQAQAAAKPEDFGALAKENSEDAPSASVKGLINPIRRHGPEKQIEQAAFNMADGEVSPVIKAGGQYVILKREELMPARKVKFEQVKSKLEETLRDRKMRSVAQDVFRQLQDRAKVKNVWNDPALREKMPGVAAMIDGASITIRALDDECITRHGQEILDGMISRKILEQACKKQNITVTDGDIDAEIARAALAGVKPKPDGSPDVKAWLELVTQKQGVPLDIYRSDVVWPSVALKKLAGDKVQVTQEDLEKGFQSNYGPRVRCLAIVLDNQRRAQEVFEMARKDNTAKNFGDLAEQYSVEPGSKAMRGEVPPIRKHGGQPGLEEEAFSLRPGELSGLIQVADKFVILRCEDYTKPVKVDFASVRDDIYADLHEKKLRLAMAERFENLQASAIIDNYLAGTSHSPKRNGASPAATAPPLRQVPGG